VQGCGSVCGCCLDICVVGYEPGCGGEVGFGDGEEERGQTPAVALIEL
jgi:hypothetical protein